MIFDNINPKMAVLALVASTMTACSTLPMATHDTQVRVQLTNTQTQAFMGNVLLRSMKDGVLITGTVTGLAPNSVHGFHIHEKGSCADAGKAAGGHFNPSAGVHGHPSSPNSHAGDMPNITANSKGIAKINYLNTKVSLTPGTANNVHQRSLILHAKADDYQSQPAGNSGDRIACAIIQ